MTDQLHGFELVKEQDVPEINSKTKLYRHIKTGAELLSVENDDENKCFGITFLTPPTDSTGLPHILEHSVLCGSRKYPTKEPFMELAKTSQATFLNAMTFSDKTMYPVASQNVQDFYNLVDVYMDSVFYPNITPETLMQEGWHYELDSADAPMVFKGVVFNEMKGAYSSPEGILGRYTEQAVLPDTIYGNDSGGDPEAIPDLTYEQFKTFHETYYHPSNARIFFYGDDDPAERLRRMDEYLRDFAPKEIDKSIAHQQPFDEPTRMVIGYDAGEDGDKKGMMTVSWLMDDTLDIERMMALEILDHILLGTTASPLRKALLESGLGENTVGGGLDTQLQQMVFSTGMKGIDVDDADKVETLILDTLKDLAENGIDKATIEASLNTVEFQLREANTGPYPRGLFRLISACSTWLYGGDPVAPLAFEAPLQAIKTRVENGESVFETLIRKYFVENQHRSTVLLKPDAHVKEEKESRERDRLARAKEAMDENAIKQTVELTTRLKELQEKPDSPEALASIPTLTVDDLDREIKTVPTEHLDLGGVPTLYHDLPTNGIAYVDVAMNLFALPQDLLPYVNLFSKTLLEMGTEREDYVKLSQRIGSKTGGIGTSSLTAEKRDEDATVAHLVVRGKATPEQVDDLIAIINDILTSVKFDNKERFKQIVLKEKASRETMLVPAGHQVVNNRLSARFNLSSWVSEQMSGVTQLFFLRELLETIENNWDSVVEKLTAVRDHLLNRDMMMFNVTVDGENWDAVRSNLAGFAESLPAKGVATQTWTPAFASGGEGLTIPAQVNYVGLGANLRDLGYQRTGASSVVLNVLRTTWLWEKVRMQGGAYGGFALYDNNTGLWRFLSYRDPNLLGTLENYYNSASFLKGLTLSQEEINRSIVGTIGNMDSYQLPDAKGYSQFLRHLIGYSDEARQQTRDEVFSTTLDHFHELGRVLEDIKHAGTIVVMGSADAINEANSEINPALNVMKVL